MEVKNGIPASPGVAICQAHLLDTDEIQIPQRFIEKNQIDEETARFEQSIVLAQKSLDREMERMGSEIQINTQILEIHKNLLSDPILKNEILEGIREKQYTAEHAVARTLNRYIKIFQGMDSDIISERVHDLIDVEKLLLKTLLGRRLETIHALEREVVVVAHNITPAQAAKLDPHCVKGLAIDVGGRTSHTAILARALGIPAVVGLETVSKTAIHGETVIVDGFRGVVMIDPDDRTIAEYREKVSDVARVAARLKKATLLPAETLDGYSVAMHANVEMSHEVPTALELGAGGVGLFRTEFVHLQKPRGGEAWHFQHYQKVVKALEGKPVVIRTLDLGGDKGMGAEGADVEENPFLGCRSIRWCFRHLDIFRAQLRAILRVSAFGPVKIMLPMVSAVHEIDRTLGFIEEVKEELREENIAFDEEIEVGVMIEVPSVAIVADLVAERVDFFSVGTNDLVQYTLAVDRANEHIAHLYEPTHPSILRLLTGVLQAGESAGIDVSICGEIASEPVFIPLLLGIGFRNLSVSPPMIPEAKGIIRSVKVHEAQKLAATCKGFSDAREISAELRSWVREFLPDVLQRW